MTAHAFKALSFSSPGHLPPKYSQGYFDTLHALFGEQL